MAKRLLNFVIMGAPGGGKGTISKKLIKDFSLKHVSTGDLLRKNIADGTEIGAKAKSFMAEGKLVPDDLVIDILAAELKTNTTHGVLLDGFPRTVAQADKLRKSIKVDVVLSLNVPHEVITFNNFLSLQGRHKLRQKKRAILLNKTDLSAIVDSLRCEEQLNSNTTMDIECKEEENSCESERFVEELQHGAFDNTSHKISKYQFVLAVLVHLSKVDTKHDIVPWLNKFSELDMSGSGYLTKQQLSRLPVEDESILSSLRPDEGDEECHEAEHVGGSVSGMEEGGGSSRLYLVEQLLVNSDFLFKMSTNEDPFVGANKKLVIKLDKLTIKSQEYHNEVLNVDTSSSIEFRDHRKALTKDIREVDKDLKPLINAVQMIEKNRSKFVHVSDTEFVNRHQFVKHAESVINDIKAQMDSVQVRQKIQSDSEKSKNLNNNKTYSSVSSNSDSPVNNPLNSTSSTSSSSHTSSNFNKNSNTSHTSNNSTKENANFMLTQKQERREIIAEQDRNLVELERGVDRIHNIAKSIKEEVKIQSTELDHLDNDISKASSKMDYVMGKLQALLQTKDGCQIWCIVTLFLILVVLVAAVIWT